LASLSITGFALKFFFLLTWSNFADWWNSNNVLRFLAIAVQPKDIPIWQWAMLINSMLMIFIWHYCGETVKKMDCGIEWSERSTIIVVRYMAAIRRVLTCYSIACNLYLYAQALPAWDLPPLGTKLVPWQ
jgi:hypothetical protein